MLVVTVNGVAVCASSGVIGSGTGDVSESTRDLSLGEVGVGNEVAEECD